MEFLAFLKLVASGTVIAGHPLIVQIMAPLVVAYIVKQFSNWIRDIYKHVKAHDTTYLSVVKSFLQDAMDKCPTANRVSFFEFSNGNFTKIYKSLDKINIRQEVIRGDVDPMINTLTDINRGMIESWEAQWKDVTNVNDTVIIRNVKDETDNTIRRILENQKVLAFAVCPIYYKKRIIGFICIDVCFNELRKGDEKRAIAVLKECKYKIERELKRL